VPLRRLCARQDAFARHQGVDGRRKPREGARAFRQSARARIRMAEPDNGALARRLLEELLAEDSAGEAAPWAESGSGKPGTPELRPAAARRRSSPTGLPPTRGSSRPLRPTSPRPARPDGSPPVLSSSSIIVERRHTRTPRHGPSPTRHVGNPETVARARELDRRVDGAPMQDRQACARRQAAISGAGPASSVHPLIGARLLCGAPEVQEPLFSLKMGPVSSTKRQSAFASLRCSTVRQSTSRSRGEHTT